MMGQTDWAPSPSDVMNLAAIRWFALTIEKLATELYITDRALYPALKDVLKHAVQDLERAKPRKLSEGECPPDYVLCDDLCVPMCDKEGPVAPSS
jgi:hypothetical protein